MTTHTLDSIDLVLSLRTGDRIRLRGRDFTLDLGGCVTHYADRSTFKAWNVSHKLVTITVRASDAVEVVR